MCRYAWLVVLGLVAPAFGITWNFDHDGDTEGWLAQDVPGGSALGSTHAPLRSVVSDGIWRIEGPAYALERIPTIGLLSPPLNLPSKLFDRIEIRCRMVHTSPVAGRIIGVWTNEYNRWDAPLQNFADYTFSTGTDVAYTGEWQEIVLAPLVSGLGERPTLWAGNLEDIQLRLSLGLPAVAGSIAWGGGPEDVPEAVEVDWIRLTGVEEQLQGELPPPLFTADTPRGQLFAPAMFQALTEARLEAVWPPDQMRGALGDLDGDGDLDLVAPVRDLKVSSQHGWLTAENTGHGHFVLSRRVASGLNQAAGVDLDRDGRMDVVSVGPSTTITCYRNDPREGWVTETTVNDEYLLGIGDLDGDGYPDLWTVTDWGKDGEIARVRRGESDGVLQSPIALGSELHAQGLTAMFTIAARGPGGRAIQEWLAPSRRVAVYWDETMTPIATPVPLYDGYLLYMGDVDADGDLDVVYAQMQGFDQIPLFKGLHLAFNHGDGSATDLVWPQDVDIHGGVAVADLNGDDLPDLVFVDSDVRQPAVIVAMGAIGGGLPIQEGRYPISGRGGAVLTGDVDNDGDIDLVVLERSVDGQGGVHVLLNQMTEKTTAVSETVDGTRPVAFALSPAYPNPFNATTVIPVSLPADAAQVSLVVYDLLGQPVRVLVNGPLSAGMHAIRWDGRDDHGAAMASGMYVYRLRTRTGEARGRVVLAR